MQKDAKQLLTVRDLARLLQISPWTVYQRVRNSPSSLPPHVRLGRNLRWRPEDVQTWLLDEVLREAQRRMQLGLPPANEEDE